MDNESIEAPPDPGLLELIYGVLFEPVRTFRRIAPAPPLGKITLLFSLVKVLTAAVLWLSWNSSSGLAFWGLPGGGRGPAGLVRSLAPLAALAALVYEYLKWFVYSGILYLLAELAGGRGKSAGVLAATGLASLPALPALPLQVLILVMGGSGALSGPLGILIWLAVITWGAVLVILGIRETQGLSTGRAVLVALAPPVTAVALMILLLVLLIVLAARMGSFWQHFGGMGF